MLQQLKLFARKIHRLAATQDLVAAQVHLDIAEGIAILLFRERLRPTQNSLHASQQFPDRKGLGDVVVGTELEAYNLIHFLATCLKHDDGNRRVLRLEMCAELYEACPRSAISCHYGCARVCVL